jgi:hypothetical protein
MNPPIPFLASQDSSLRWKYSSKSSIDTGASLGTGVGLDVEVDVIEFREIVFASGPNKGNRGLALTLAVRDSDDSGLWRFFEQSKREFGASVSKYFQEICGEQFEIAEIHYKRGSIILTMVVAVNAWGVAHQGIISVIGFVFGLYLPLKTLITDSQKWIPRLKTFIVAFFRGRPRTPVLIRH